MPFLFRRVSHCTSHVHVTSREQTHSVRGRVRGAPSAASGAACPWCPMRTYAHHGALSPQVDNTNVDQSRCMHVLTMAPFPHSWAIPMWTVPSRTYPVGWWVGPSYPVAIITSSMASSSSSSSSSPHAATVHMPLPHIVMGASSGRNTRAAPTPPLPCPPPPPHYATAADRSGEPRGDVGPPLRAMSSPYIRGDGAAPCRP